MGSDLTPRQYAVLASVAKSEGLSQTDLVAETGIDRSTLADVVRRMLKKGLIQRRRTKHDARAYAVRLTEEGRRILAESEPLVREIDQRILEVLPPAERLQFLDDLSAIINATDVALKEVSED
jgi:DNA-binding MarR family transcriptional regulator